MVRFGCLFLLGLATWPVFEYFLHRYLGHVFKVQTLFKIEHTRHHVEGGYFAPFKTKALAVLPVCIVMALIFGMPFTAGFIVMYQIYEHVHRSFHIQAPSSWLGMQLRKHHLIHHFHNSKMNHGVTVRWFDYLMSTYLDVAVVRIPKNKAPHWLLTEDQSQLRGEYADQFVLTR